jgi:achilleol B synthase
MLILLLHAQEDLRYSRSLLQTIVWACVNEVVEPVLNIWPANKILRDVAMEKVMQHIHYEDETTEYICACPINKVMCERI